MSKIIWDSTGDRLFETGIDKVVLYRHTQDKLYGKGVAWNGVTAFNEAPDGGEANDFYADNIKYLTIMSTENYKYTLEAYTYPDEWQECDGSAELSTGVTIGQQKRQPFGLCCRSLLGNDVEDTDYGYKLHLVYGSKAAPSSKDRATINDSPEAATFSWEVTTTPVEITKTIDGQSFKPTANITIDSTKISADALKALEDALYGTDDQEAYLPLPDEVIDIIETASASAAG